MKNYRLYELIDFVIDEDFIRWVQYNEDSDNQFWKRWLDDNPDKHLVIAEAKRLVEVMPRSSIAITEDDILLETDKLLQTISRTAGEVKMVPQSFGNHLKWLCAAAAIIIILGVGAYLLVSGDKSKTPFSYAYLTSVNHLVEKVNFSGKPIQVTLNDGSIVELASNSKMSYYANFDSLQTRDIYLSGEAFFKVTKNPARPFRVFANEIITKVLGTSFTVSSFDSDSLISVTVKTGKVSVTDQQAATSNHTAVPNVLDGIIVTPNQQLVYERKRQKFEKVLLDNPIKIKTVTERGYMVYEDAPLEKVFNDLGKAYGINIVFDEEVVSNCTVSGDLNNVSFYQKLDLICRAVGAQYKVADGQIVIDAEGCK